MDDDVSAAIEVVNNIVSRVLDGLTISLGAARKEIRTNPLAMPDRFAGDGDFIEAADFGLFVAQTIVEKVNSKFRDERRVLN